MAKRRRYIKVKDSVKSKYRFSKQKVYKDKDGNSYFYQGKNMGVFQFEIIMNDKTKTPPVGRFYERHMDVLQLKEESETQEPTKDNQNEIEGLKILLKDAKGDDKKAIQKVIRSLETGIKVIDTWSKLEDGNPNTKWTLEKSEGATGQILWTTWLENAKGEEQPNTRKVFKRLPNDVRESYGIGKTPLDRQKLKMPSSISTLEEFKHWLNPTNDGNYPAIIEVYTKRSGDRAFGFQTWNKGRIRYSVQSSDGFRAAKLSSFNKVFTFEYAYSGSALPPPKKEMDKYEELKKKY
jgi:hypothetical protein